MYQSLMSRKYAKNYIREIRKSRGLTMEEVALRLGDVTLATIQKLETSQMGLTLDYMQALSGVLDCQPIDLISSTQSATVRDVPLVGSIAAGNWQEAVQISSDTITIPDEAGGPRAFALRAVGDSMDLLVSDGSYIIVDPDQTDLIDGKCYAVMNGHAEATFKRFRLDPPRLEPCSSNPNHKPIPIGKEPFTIIGRVTYSGSFL